MVSLSSAVLITVPLDLLCYLVDPLLLTDSEFVDLVLEHHTPAIADG